MSRDVVVCEAVAKRDYHPSPYDRQALPPRKGDRIAVLDMSPNGTRRGKCGGREGKFKFFDVEVDRSQVTVQHQPDVSFHLPKAASTDSVSTLLSSLQLEDFNSL